MLSEMSFLFLLGLAGEGRAPRACAHVCMYYGMCMYVSVPLGTF